MEEEPKVESSVTTLANSVEIGAMKILAVNCGSSTLKFQVIDARPEEKAADIQLPIAGGTIERIGVEPRIVTQILAY